MTAPAFPVTRWGTIVLRADRNGPEHLVGPDRASIAAHLAEAHEAFANLETDEVLRQAATRNGDVRWTFTREHNGWIRAELVAGDDHCPRCGRVLDPAVDVVDYLEGVWRCDACDVQACTDCAAPVTYDLAADQWRHLPGTLGCFLLPEAPFVGDPVRDRAEPTPAPIARAWQR